MRRLLIANLTRLKMNLAFWITVFLMMGIELIFSFMLMNQSLPTDNILFISLQSIGVLSSVFFSLFIGTEYNDGTMRNKIIVGHKRSHIYFANFVTGVIAVTIIDLAGIFIGGILGFFFYTAPIHGINQIFVAFMIGWLASVSYVSIFNLIGMLSSSKAKTSIICILTAFILVFFGGLCFALLSNGENVICQFLYEFNPLGQTVQTMVISISSPLKFIIYAIILSCICNGVGLYVFHSKDLK